MLSRWILPIAKAAPALRASATICVGAAPFCGVLRASRPLLAQQQPPQPRANEEAYDLESVDEERVGSNNGGQQLSTDVDDADGAPAQAFDLTEATLQEVHDLVVAMIQHKRMTNSAPNLRCTLHRHFDDAPYYNRADEFSAGHRLFTEWLDKLEKMLTRDIMRALRASAEYTTRDPSVAAAVEAQVFVQKKAAAAAAAAAAAEGEQPAEPEPEGKHDPTTHAGFLRHPLHCPSATGTRRRIARELPAHDAVRLQRQKAESYSRFFTHAPYQVLVARPDASTELQAQVRCRRDRHTLDALADLCDVDRWPQPRRVPVRDQQRINKIVADALDYDSA